VPTAWAGSQVAWLGADWSRLVPRGSLSPLRPLSPGPAAVRGGAAAGRLIRPAALAGDAGGETRLESGPVPAPVPGWPSRQGGEGGWKSLCQGLRADGDRGENP